MEVRELGKDEVATWRELKLAALRESPDAFRRTYEEGSRRSMDAWERAVREAATSPSVLSLVAEVEGRPVGFARCRLDHDRPFRAEVVLLWVRPEERGSGAARLLMERTLDWATERDATLTELFVTEGNEAAFNLYASLGFEDTGVREPLRKGSDLQSILMRRVLDPGPSDGKAWPDGALREACEALRLPSRGWEILRIGHCASVALPEAGLVARVGRLEASPEHMAQEARFARRVRGAGVPVLAPAEGLPIPLRTKYGPVTFWPLLDADPDDAYDWAWLGDALRRLHGLPLEVGRPSLWDPLARVDERVKTYAARPGARRDYVEAFTDASAAVRMRLEEMRSGMPASVLHGDPGPGNTLVGPEGPVLVDFDLAGVGPPAWDLTLPFVLRRRLGLPDEALARFLDAYGSDPRGTRGFDVLMRTAELLHASFALIRSDLGETDRRELDVRMRAVLDSSDRSGWGLVGRPST